ncbi:acyl-CoA dehydrogenase family protein [Amorphus sp. 3PC139-8]|uniref:acyl-CoA dehydrogenase family protein n=1 Tax=Amorphus sp. 3PC139-8 TaxID=2735676 RepID=UPI00345CDDA6
MKFELSDEDHAFRAAARAWLVENVPSEPAPHDGQPAREFALSWLRRRHAAGWSGIAWPKAYGGLGLSYERQIAWHEESVIAGAPSPLDPTFVSVNHAGPTLIACGTEEQKAFHLPKILSGEVVWCQGFSEPDSGSDLASLRTFGRVEGDHLIVNGQKIWSTYADIADYQELLIRTEPGSERQAGLSWVICDMSAPGITVQPIGNIAGAHHFAQVFYDDVRIPLSNVVGGLNNGWKTAMTTLGFERATAATALQIELSAKVEALLRFAEVQGDGGFAHELASARAEAAALRALTYRTLFKDPTTPFDGSMVRLFFAELAQRIHRLGMQLYGPENADCDRLSGWVYAYLEAFSETIAGGTAEIQRNIIGERILGLPRGGNR